MLLVLLVYVLFRGWRQKAMSQIAAFGGLTLGLVVGILVVPLIGGSQAVQALDAALSPPPDVAGRIPGYLDDQGFPQVFGGAGRGQWSTVQILGIGCGAKIGAGSGFVTQPGFVVTNAHVIAGFARLRVRDAAGAHPAVTIHVDPALDIAVLSAPDVQAPAIGWTDTAATRGTEGVTLGFPGAQSQMVVQPATVRSRIEVVGRDIYGEGSVRREILVLAAALVQGDSGGPFVTNDGLVGGVVFAGNPGDRATGYALTAEQVRPGIESAIARNQEAGVGACRF
ncbi:MAG: trypsin-like peptidase domain-containing protein [Actinomycetota bacterium]|nr:trypsin-like peptidase domain-containing protein [Actinomycetota bacterium]